MKIKNIKKRKLIKNHDEYYSKMLRSKNENNDKISFIDMDQTEIGLKKSLKIIYKYHTANKRILFIGVKPSWQKKFKKIFSQTKHIFLSSTDWVDGTLTNSYVTKVNVRKKVRLKRLISRIEPELIVALNFNEALGPLNEAAKLRRIPTICVHNDEFGDSRISYLIPFEEKDYVDKFSGIVFSYVITIIKRCLELEALLKQQEEERKKANYYKKRRRNQQKYFKYKNKKNFNKENE